MAALAYYSSSSEEDSSDVDQDILSLHQSSASSRTTLRSNSPGAVHQPAVAGLPSAGACEHIIVLLEDEEQREKFLKRHKALLTWGLKNASDVRRTGATLERPSKRRKLQVPACNECGKTLQKPFVCLECSFAGCWRDAHIVNHLENSGHDFALDVLSGSIFCGACDDLIFHPELEDIFNDIKTKSERAKARLKDSGLEVAAALSRRKEAISQASSDPASLVCCSEQKGILNLGASCYLNVVLQTLVHNPMLKSWFMSDRHPNQLCSRATCVSCEMDKLFGEIFSADKSPLAPITFLRALWKTSDEIAGYAQHDAHEVLIAILNSIHTSSSSPSAPTRISPPSLSRQCTCPIHAVFGAYLQSDVTCGKCGTTRSTTDPLLDVSLDLELGGKENSLGDCLKRYTRTEKLGAKEQVLCQSCATMSENATRRLSIRKLPPVLCFQFKRFEHSALSANSTKIDAPVRYPSSIDMTPFTSASIGKEEALLELDGQHTYDLFAVVNHEGQMDTGHYTAFARTQDSWHKFDDEKVSSASLADVLSSRTKAYMCFYIRRSIDYSSSSSPPAIPSSSSITTATAGKGISGQTTNGAPKRTGATPPLIPVPTPKRPIASLPLTGRPSLTGTGTGTGIVKGTGPPQRFIPPASAGLPPKPMV